MNDTKDASQGDVLYFDQGVWVPAPLVGLKFISGWDAENNIPELFNNGQYKNYNNNNEILADTGDYFVVSAAGATELGSQNYWQVGDWIIFNGNSWQKINNTGVVASIFGRVENVIPQSNDYNWNMIDKGEAKLLDLGDTPDQLTVYNNGQILKWNNSEEKWTLEYDLVGIKSGNVKSSDIINGSISNTHISETAEIDISKVNDLEQLINKKLSIAGGQLTGNLDLNNHKLIFDSAGTINNKTVDTFLIELTNLTQSMLSKENKFLISDNPEEYLSGHKDESGTRLWIGLNTSLVTEGITNKFLSAEKVLESKLDNYQKGNVDFLSPDDSILNAFGTLEQKIISFNDNLVINNDNIPEVTLDKLSTDMGGSNGLLNLGENKWSLKMISGLQFKGSWNATNSYPENTASGDYYIISEDGVFDDKNWKNGDWAIYNGTSWQQINNAGTVHSFNNRSGNIIPCPGLNCDTYDYTWSMINKEQSTIDDITDVSTSGAVNGQVLKLSANGKWAAATDLAGAGNGGIDSESIAVGTVRNIDIKLDADILQSKIKDLSNNLLGKLPVAGGTLSGNLDLGNNNLVGVSKINGEDISLLLNSANNIEADVDAKEDTLEQGNINQFLNGDKEFINFNSDDITEGINNLYFTHERVLITPLDNYSLANNNFDILPQDSILTAVGKISGRLEHQELPHSSISSEDIFEKSITASKFATANAVEGDTFVFSNSTDGWVLRPLSGMKYLGTWNLVSNGDLPVNATNGEYYIISSGNESWSEGDWAVYNDQGDGEWQRISNSKNLESFNNREGLIEPEANDYSWDQLNFSGSSINSLSDINTSGAVEGQVLKWSVSEQVWIVGDDEEKTTSNLTGNSFANSSILPQHFKSAGIQVSHIEGLQNTINEFYPINGTEVLKRSIDLDGNNIINLNLINGVNVTDISNLCGGLDPSIYQSKLTPDPLLEFQFLEWPGIYSEISLDDLLDVSSSVKLYAPSRILDLPLTGYVKNQSGEALTDGDSLIETFQKLEGKIDGLSSGSSAGFFPVSSNTNLSPADNGKTFFASGESTQVSLPVFENVVDGYQITVKRVDTNNQISINGGSTNMMRSSLGF